MKAISLSRPWDWCVVYGGKRIENREWGGRMPPICHHRGPLLLHAAKSLDREVRDWCYDRKLPLPPPEGIAAGAIVGRCRAVGHLEPWKPVADSKLPCHREAKLVLDGVEGSKFDREQFERILNRVWWMGGYALVLADVEPTKVVKCRGHLGVWTVPDDVMRELEIAA